MLIDSHCHLDHFSAEELPLILQSAKDSNVDYMLSVCTEIEDFSKIIAIAHGYNNIFASVGLHPEEIVSCEPSVETILKLASDPLVVAIGETGLDFYHAEVPREVQIARFRRHINVAKEINKPLIVHMRDATEDTMRILQKEAAGKINGVMHCFVEDISVAQRAIDFGFYISFSGIVTFPKALKVKETAKLVPLNRFLIETDSPYLAPAPFRGKVNQPSYVKYVAKCLAELREIDYDRVSKVTSDNFFELFRPGRGNR